MSKSHKVLVTGATGFIGSNLVRRLVSEEYEVHILTRKNSDKWRIADILPDLSDHYVDLLEEKNLKQVVEQIEPDVVFHLATLGIYGGVHSPEREVLQTNIFGTVNLINACQDIKYKCFVNTGSSSEYGLKSYAMKETDVCEPINVYGISKCASTLYGRFIAKTNNKPIIGLRLFSPFGPYDDSRRLIPYAVVNALQNKQLNLANANAVRDYIFIDDVVDLYLKSIEIASKFVGEVYNVGRGSNVSVDYVVKKILEIADSRSPIKWNSFAGRDHDYEKWEADIGKISRDFNWQPKYNIDEGIRKTITWFRDNLHSY
ncbi:MAG: GDP-L-fucose synthase [Euryarchaeota archaeon]|nr:GDP-L-fucose synthase [Euryarchaeota archaeon]